ncbi:hypothetical protein [Liquorilactobacillus hordei]|uniref:hypothetical protein n=1 Tax=Liquorilactobacillus hordei TaxID=468911 RepID=UPI001CBE81EE|nr:hypothetical protein [Liquorilactobacillus hordei]MBZ2405278.1 hypothetical protein [Liquorilactobacillus hordei]
MKILSRFMRIEIAIFILVLAVIVLLNFVQNSYSSSYFATCILIFLGLLTSIVLPSLLVTWAALFVLLFGSFIMIFGLVYVPNVERIVLISTFPIFCALGIWIKYLVGIRGSALSAKDNISTYISHINSVTKLKNRKNAENYFMKYIKFIKDAMEKNLNVEMDVTCIEWAHSRQFKIISDNEYREVLKSISGTLKDIRTPDESIFFIDDATFLILSPKLTEQLQQDLTVITRRELDKIKFVNQNLEHNLQFRFSFEVVGNKELEKIDSYEKLEKKVRRGLETDIVVEYQ